VKWNHISAVIAVWPMIFVGVLHGVSPGAEWHDSLYLSGSDYWRGRIAVTVHNDADQPVEGQPVAVPLGPGQGQADLVGTRVREVRVCDEKGTEMLFGLQDRGGAITDGLVPDGGTLYIPVECPAGGSAVYYVYFDNPSAGRVAEFLPGRHGLVNGDMEAGSSATPWGWKHDVDDGSHQATWSQEDPQSGKRCLKTVVAADAEPTWIATRQQNIRLIGGARYMMTAWVCAENVKGDAGWYIHLGNRTKGMLASPMLLAGGGTYGWKQVTAEFTAPADADRADLGTVLRGTGTARFDNVTLRCLDADPLRAVAGKPERLSAREIGSPGRWHEEPGSTAAWDHRAVVRLMNFAARDAGPATANFDLAMLDARLGGRLDRDSLRVVDREQVVPHQVLGDRLLWTTDALARSVSTVTVYFSRLSEDSKKGATGGLPALVHQGNLLTNPDFEQGDQQADAMPTGWTCNMVQQADSGPKAGFDSPRKPGLGKLCARLDIPAGTPEGWRGWVQNVPVEPGKTYLAAAWVKCKESGGGLRIHAHFRDVDGGLCTTGAMQSAGGPLAGTTDWTLLSGLLHAPPDAASMSIHLTTNTSGTVWHDGALLVETTPARFARFEGRPMADEDRLAAWPVDSIVKIFPDDPVPRNVSPAEIALARNEKEVLQLAVRSGRVVGKMRVEVEPLVGPDGTTLDDVEVNVVGYVPIDHPTNYYRSESPTWHRKFPRYGAGCDGWPGLWPDPLIPGRSFTLKPNATRAVWITVGTTAKTPSGRYHGAVKLWAGDTVVARIPFSVEVWDFTLPEETHLAAIYDVRLGPGGALWGKPLEEMYPEIVEFMAERRLCPDTVRPFPRFSYIDGKVTADFTQYDKAAEIYFDRLKLPVAYTPWTFYLFGWGHPPKTCFGQRPYEGDPPYTDADRGELRPEFKRAYQAMLRLYWDHLKAKGWEKKVVLYISDEPFDGHEHIRRQMRALCEMIHEVDSAIPIYSSTWRHIPDWDGSLDVWGIGHDGRVPVEQMARLRAAGDRLWFTTDGQMCTDTPYCAVERLLPHYCFKYDVQAYEFWGVAWLTHDPYRFGWHAYIHQTSEPGNSFWVRYPNGDGFLIYPGPPIGYDGLVSSIRLENAREGVEDYEYLYLLRSLIERAETAGLDATSARAAMTAASRLVTIPNAGGRYSSKVLTDPGALLDARRQLAEEIEALDAR